MRNNPTKIIRSSVFSADFGDARMHVHVLITLGLQ